MVAHRHGAMALMVLLSACATVSGTPEERRITAAFTDCGGGANHRGAAQLFLAEGGFDLVPNARRTARYDEVVSCMKDRYGLTPRGPQGQPGRDIAFGHACAGLGGTVVSGACGRWVVHDFVLIPVPADALDRHMEK